MKRERITLAMIEKDIDAAFGAWRSWAGNSDDPDQYKRDVDNAWNRVAAFLCCVKPKDVQAMDEQPVITRFADDSGETFEVVEMKWDGDDLKVKTKCGRYFKLVNAKAESIKIETGQGNT